MEITTAGWVQRQQSDTERWDWVVPEDSKSHGWISNYSDTNQYYWQAHRHDGEVSGIVEGREAAMQVTEEMMALPLEDFYVIVAGSLREELTRLEQKLLCVLPGHDFLPGYHAGYKAGVSEIKRRVEALEIE